MKIEDGLRCLSRSARRNERVRGPTERGREGGRNLGGHAHSTEKNSPDYCRVSRLPPSPFKKLSLSPSAHSRGHRRTRMGALATYTGWGLLGSQIDAQEITKNVFNLSVNYAISCSLIQHPHPHPVQESCRHCLLWSRLLLFRTSHM